MKSGRSYLADHGETEVDILNVAMVAPGLIALSFRDENKVRRDDLYNCTDDQASHLLQERAGKDVRATLRPDSSADTDGFPEVVSVDVLPEQEESAGDEASE